MILKKGEEERKKKTRQRERQNKKVPPRSDFVDYGYYNTSTVIEKSGDVSTYILTAKRRESAQGVKTEDGCRETIRSSSPSCASIK